MHNPDGMIALCPEHHHMADGGHFSNRQLEEYKRSPYVDNILKVPWRFSSESLVMKVGRNLVVGSGSPIRMNGRPILYFRPRKIENLDVSTTVFDSDIRDVNGLKWLRINDGWFDLRLENTTDVIFKPQMRQISAKHKDNTYISAKYNKLSYYDFIDWAASFIRSKNFTAEDAGKTVEKVGAVDSDGNVPIMTIEGAFKAKNITVNIKGDDLHTVLSLHSGHEDACMWKNSRIVNGKYRQIIRWAEGGPEIFSVG